MTDSSELFVFHGVLPICVENRLLNTVIDKNSKDIIVTEFEPHFNGTTNIKKRTVNLPGEITSQRIIGQPLCIGCKHDCYVFQFISVSVRHIQFFCINMDDYSVRLFSDSVHYFRKDIAKISPIECHISPDKHVIMLRLPQAVLKLNKQSNILMVQCNERCIVTNSKLLDKKYTCVLFNPALPQTLLLVQVNDISSKCNLKMYDIVHQKLIIQRDQSINTFSCDFDSQDEDQDNELFMDFDSRVMSLLHTSAVFNRTGDLFLLTCLPVVQTFVTLYGFDANSLQLKFSMKTETNLPSKLSLSDLISTEVSMCNTILNIYQLVKFSHNTKQTMCTVKLPVVLNLKCQVRTSILRHFTGHELEVIMRSLPKQLRTYMNMIESRQE